MELRVLNYFLLVAREENITRAAQLLHVTQPTLSRQMMQLEEELGVKLFKRSNHRIILTDDGLLLRRRAQEILTLAEKTKREFSREGQLSGEIAIGSGEFKSSRLLTAMMASFHKKHPLVQYQMYSGNSDNIKERIEQGTLDMGLLQDPVDIRKYEFIRLPVKEEWGILIREDSELADKEYVTPKDLVGYPLLLPGRELVRNEVMNWFGTYADQLEIILGGNLLYNMAMMVKNGLGITFTIRLECSFEGLKFVPIQPQIRSGTLLAWKKNQPFSGTAGAFIRHVKECLEKLPEEGEIFE